MLEPSQVAPTMPHPEHDNLISSQFVDYSVRGHDQLTIAGTWELRDRTAGLGKLCEIEHAPADFFGQAPGRLGSVVAHIVLDRPQIVESGS